MVLLCGAHRNTGTGVLENVAPRSRLPFRAMATGLSDDSADAVDRSYVSHPGPTAVAGPTYAPLPAQTEQPLTPQPAPLSPPMVPESSIAARGAVTRALQQLCALAVMGARVATAYSDLNICLQRHQTDIVDQVLQLFQCLAEGVPSSTLVCLSVAVRVFFFTST